jgi:hypothetical protein
MLILSQSKNTAHNQSASIGFLYLFSFLIMVSQFRHRASNTLDEPKAMANCSLYRCLVSGDWYM